VQNWYDKRRCMFSSNWWLSQINDYFCFSIPIRFGKGQYRFNCMNLLWVEVALSKQSIRIIYSFWVNNILAWTKYL
jgi:hypothetical protein